MYPRLYKEATHQLAHLFNLSDCRNPRCVNYYSQMMLDIDSKGERLVPGRWLVRSERLDVVAAQRVQLTGLV